jgi:hypothetical protein
VVFLRSGVCPDCRVLQELRTSACACRSRTPSLGEGFRAAGDHVRPASFPRNVRWEPRLGGRICLRGEFSTAVCPAIMAQSDREPSEGFRRTQHTGAIRPLFGITRYANLSPYAHIYMLCRTAVKKQFKMLDVGASSVCRVNRHRRARIEEKHRNRDSRVGRPDLRKEWATLITLQPIAKAWTAPLQSGGRLPSPWDRTVAALRARAPRFGCPQHAFSHSHPAQGRAFARAQTLCVHQGGLPRAGSRDH